MATVLGLAAGAEVYGPNSTRLPDFMAAWTRAWPGLHIEHQPTFANHPDLRGYGVAAGYYVGLVRSMAYLRDRNATCDYHLMFEDDGLPFNGTTWPGTGDGSATPNDLDARLDALEAVHGAALALGGHRFVNVSRADAAQAAARPRGGIVSAGRADGAYALVIACAALPGVAAHLHAHLRQATSRFYFEQALWSALKGTGTGPYVSVPLLVDHAHGFSATWNRTVDRAFEGNATFW